MHGDRDLFLRRGERQSNWLRVAQHARARFVARALWHVALRTFARAGSLRAGGRALGVQRLHRAGRAGALTQHTGRCRASGRARQVLRVAQLARMHLRAAMSEGRLAHLRHGRRSG